MTSQVHTQVKGKLPKGKCSEPFIIPLYSDDDESDYEGSDEDDGPSESENDEGLSSESDVINDNSYTDSDSVGMTIFTPESSIMDACAPPFTPPAPSTPYLPIPPIKPINSLEFMVDELVLALQFNAQSSILQSLESAIINYLHCHPVTPTDVDLLIPSLKHRTSITRKLTSSIAVHYVHRRITEVDKEAIFERFLTHGSIRNRNGSWSDRHFQDLTGKIHYFREKRKVGRPTYSDTDPKKWKHYERQQQAEREKEMAQQEAQKASERETRRRIKEFPKRYRKRFATDLEREWMGAVSYADFYCNMCDLTWADVKQIQAKANEEKKHKEKEKAMRAVLEEIEKWKIAGVQPDAVGAGLSRQNADVATRVCIPKPLPDQTSPPIDHLRPASSTFEYQKKPREQMVKEAEWRTTCRATGNFFIREYSFQPKVKMPHQTAKSLKQKKEEKWWSAWIAVPRCFERVD